MNKFNKDDKVVVVNSEELKRINSATQLCNYLFDLETDIIEVDMTGTIVKSVDDGNKYFVDFGEGFKGVDATSEKIKSGTCAIVSEDSLQLVEEPKEEFKPYLLITVNGDEFAGYIGKETKLKTTKGNTLCIGDIVKVDGMLSVVVEDKDGEFFMGFKMCSLLECFELNSIVKVFSYNDVWDGDIISGVKYVTDKERE